MATVTTPIMTDATGQSIDSKLNSLLGKMDNLAAAFQPNASGIVYSNTTSGLTGDDVQEAIDEMAADVSEINSSLSNLIKSTTISDTTTASGALSLGAFSDKPILDFCYDDSHVGLIFRRDKSYFTCCDNNRTPLPSTAVVVKVWYVDI